MQSTNPFVKLQAAHATRSKNDLYVSVGIHGGIFVLLILMGWIAGSRETVVPMGGGEFVSVEMIVLDTGDNPSEMVSEVVEDVQEEVVEVVEEIVSESVEEVVEVEVEEVEVETTEPVEDVQTEVAPLESTEFIGVGSSGEAGSGSPGPASYEGRVFGAIRRNFRTSVIPAQSYQISFTVNPDGTHSHEVLRTSGDNGFDRAVTHALNSASIPPIPPGRTSPVNLRIEFFGPETE